MSDIDRYLTDEVVEKAARAEWEHEWPERSWERAPFANQDFYRSVAHASLSAVLPEIIQKAKAEALRDFASASNTSEFHIEVLLGGSDYVRHVLRDRANRIEQGGQQ